MPLSTTPLSRLSLRIEQAKWEFKLPEGAGRVIAAADFEGREFREPLDSTGSSFSSGEALAPWLADEPELCQRLLRWCNTPLYNLARPFRSLEEAAGVMEARELSRLAVLACARGLFLPDLEIDQYRREGLWNHSIAVGAVASMISRTCGRGDPSTVFLAGTLHDIGLCASEQLDPDAFAEVIALVDELSPINEVEKELLGWDHAELGEAILNQWGMPESVAMVARYHHDPDHVLSGPEGAAVGCVAVANYLCSRAGWQAAGRHYLPPPSNRVFAHLGIDASLLTVIWQQLYMALESAVNLR